MKAVLFDLDDTLILEWKSAENSFLETISLLEFPTDRQVFLKTIRAKAKENWYNLPTIDFALKIGISSWEALWADFTGADKNLIQLRELAAGYRFQTWHQTLKLFNIDNPELAEKLSLDFKRIRSTKHILFPETHETLNMLKNKYKLGLITNGAPDLQWKKIRGGKLENYFDFIAISGEYGFAKPDVRLFEVALKGLGFSPSQVVMIGDRLDTDIKGAKDCGMKTVWVNRNKTKSENIEPDYEISCLLDFFNIF